MKRQTLKTNKTVTVNCVGSSNLSEAGWSTSRNTLFKSFDKLLAIEIATDRD
jgi:hypothetical protein